MSARKFRYYEECSHIAERVIESHRWLHQWKNLKRLYAHLIYGTYHIKDERDKIVQAIWPDKYGWKEKTQ